MKCLLHLCFCYYFEQAHFVMFSGLLVFFFFFFAKLLNYTAYFVKNLHPFFCVLPNMWFEKLKLFQILLMLDWFHA